MRREFDRAAVPFAERTRGRFDALGVPEFSRVSRGETVVEVGAGTGNFLSLFDGIAGRLVAVDLSPAMLRTARAAHATMHLVCADAVRLPLATASASLVASAQVLHHVYRPLPVLAEMARVAGPAGRVLIVDQVATERYEEAVVMTRLEKLRDPSHAASGPPSALRTLIRAAGLRIVDEKLHQDEQRLSMWMWRGEFPRERIEAVKEFISRHGADTGMGFERQGSDFIFTRRRAMFLARA